MPENDEERTEQATPKRRQEAREEGRVAKSVELNTVFILVTALVFYYFFSTSFAENLMKLFTHYIGIAPGFELTTNNFVWLVKDITYKMLHILVPFFILMLFISILINVIQVGFMITPKVLEIKFDKINPVNGFKNMFSLKSFGELVKSLLKVLVVSYILYIFVKHSLPHWFGLIDTQTITIAAALGKSTFAIVGYITIFLLLMAILDYLLQKYTFEKSIRMSIKEIKDEHKQLEGDPLIKSRIRRLQMELARKRMMEGVKTADVVITNPTHYAVALKYDEDTMPAPTCVAKGMNKLAERIKKIAMEHDVAIVENPSLARELYKRTDVGEIIPRELYQAVAEVLAYVYNLKNRHP